MKTEDFTEMQACMDRRGAISGPARIGTYNLLEGWNRGGSEGKPWNKTGQRPYNARHSAKSRAATRVGDTRASARLIEPKFPPPGSLKIDEQSPRNVHRFLTYHLVLFQVGYRGLEVISHQEQFMAAILRGGMGSDFGGRQLEDEPISSSIHMG